jgi:hypothetical protein
MALASAFMNTSMRPMLAPNKIRLAKNNHGALDTRRRPVDRAKAGIAKSNTARFEKRLPMAPPSDITATVARVRTVRPRPS